MIKVSWQRWALQLVNNITSQKFNNFYKELILAINYILGKVTFSIYEGDSFNEREG